MNEDVFAEACERFASQMTPKRRALFEAMLAKIGHGWALVPGHGLKIRWTQQLPFPGYMRHGAYTNWPDTYDRHVFLTLVTPRSNPILGLARSPWTGRRDLDISLKRATEVLADPEASLELPPINDKGAVA